MKTQYESDCERYGKDIADSLKESHDRLVEKQPPPSEGVYILDAPE